MCIYVYIHVGELSLHRISLSQIYIKLLDMEEDYIIHHHLGVRSSKIFLPYKGISEYFYTNLIRLLMLDQIRLYVTNIPVASKKI